MLEASAAGRSLSAELRRSRAYRNPYFLEKMVDHLGLDPRASRLRGCEGEGTEEGKPSSAVREEDTADALEVEEAAARRAASSAVSGRVDFVREGGGEAEEDEEEEELPEEGGEGGGGTDREKKNCKQKNELENTSLWNNRLVFSLFGFHKIEGAKTRMFCVVLYR